MPQVYEPPYLVISPFGYESDTEDPTAPIEVCIGSYITYRITQVIEDPNYNGPIGDIIVYISYLGSTLVDGIDFFGPSKVYLKSDYNHVDFDIIFDKEADVSSKIVITPTSDINLVLKSMTLTMKDCTNRGNEASCCGYVPKDYKLWSNGYGVPDIVSPYERSL